MDRTLDNFLTLVKDSVNGQAKRKNYSKNDADGDNLLVNVTSALGITASHGVGEIVYKCAEYLHTPREVLLVKIAGWAFILWKARAEE